MRNVPCAKAISARPSAMTAARSMDRTTADKRGRSEDHRQVSPEAPVVTRGGESCPHMKSLFHVGARNRTVTLPCIWYCRQYRYFSAGMPRFGSQLVQPIMQRIDARRSFAPLGTRHFDQPGGQQLNDQHHRDMEQHRPRHQGDALHMPIHIAARREAVIADQRDRCPGLDDGRQDRIRRARAKTTT